MTQPQDAALTAILNGLTERHSFMLATSPQPAILAQALFGVVSNLAPMVRATLAPLSDVLLPNQTSTAGPLPLYTLAALLLGKPIAARDVDDVEQLLTRLTQPADSETRLVLILGGADRLRADSFAYLRMAAELTSRSGFQLHVVFVGGPQFPALLSREGGQLAERVQIRPALSATTAAEAQPMPRATPDQLRQPLLMRQNAASAAAAPGGWLSRLWRSLVKAFGAGDFFSALLHRRSRQPGDPRSL